MLKYRGKDVIISLDSTGIKVTNRGEWIRHKWKVKRGWIKVHAAVDDGKRWYGEIPHSVIKRKFGEFVRAAKEENMYHEAKLKYIFYNAMRYYDETGIPIWRK